MSDNLEKFQEELKSLKTKIAQAKRDVRARKKQEAMKRQLKIGEIVVKYLGEDKTLEQYEAILKFAMRNKAPKSGWNRRSWVR